MVADDLSPILAQLPTVLPIPLPAPYNVSEVDFSLLTVAVAANHLAAGVRGSINDTTPTHFAYPVTTLCRA